MEKFWAVVLIFAVVAVVGLMYVTQVYIPQKDAQALMAETSNQTIESVRSEVESTGGSLVSGTSVVDSISKTYAADAAVHIKVRTKFSTAGGTITYYPSNTTYTDYNQNSPAINTSTAPSASGPATNYINPSGIFSKKIVKDATGAITEIIYEQQ